jgi:hypothetical protein
VKAARTASRALDPVGATPLRIGVAKADAAEAAALLRDAGVKVFRSRVGAAVALTVPNLRDLSNEEHTFADLLDALVAAGIDVRWASVP